MFRYTLLYSLTTILIMPWTLLPLLWTRPHQSRLDNDNLELVYPSGTLSTLFWFNPFFLRFSPSTLITLYRPLWLGTVLITLYSTYQSVRVTHHIGPVVHYSLFPPFYSTLDKFHPELSDPFLTPDGTSGDKKFHTGHLVDSIILHQRNQGTVWMI